MALLVELVNDVDGLIHVILIGAAGYLNVWVYFISILLMVHI